jgi:hypothetical protein
MLHRRRCTAINRLKSNTGPNAEPAPATCPPKPWRRGKAGGRGFPRILHTCNGDSASQPTALRIISPNPSYLRPRRPPAPHRGSHLPKSFIVGGAQGFPRRSSAPAAALRTGKTLPQILHSCGDGYDFPRPSCSHNPPKSFIVTPARRAEKRSSLLISRTYWQRRGRGSFPKSFIVGGAPARPSGSLVQLFSRCSVVSGRGGEGRSGFPKSFIVGRSLQAGSQIFFRRPDFSYLAERVSVSIAERTRISPNPS